MNVEALVFGDLLLEDIRRYRERSLEGTGMPDLTSGPARRARVQERV
jgi:hypothetical protein